MITRYFQTGLAAFSLLSITSLSAPVQACDYRIPARGSMPQIMTPNGYGSLKDVPTVMAPPSGNCYLRGDIGYSISGEPKTYFYSEIGMGYPSGELVEADRESGWLAEVGVGCGADILGRGAIGYGLRFDTTFGVRQDWDVTGGVPGKTAYETATASVTSYTQMFNFYKDFGMTGRVTPYVGAGIGFAYHDMDHVDVNHDGITYSVEGDADLAFAWSLMAGISVQVSSNVKLDFGYRYIDMGRAESGTEIVSIYGALPEDPYLSVDDLTAHELKVGMRYSFGGR